MICWESPIYTSLIYNCTSSTIGDPTLKRLPFLTRLSLFLMPIMLLLLTLSDAHSQTDVEALTDTDNRIQTGSAGIAWGDPDGEHSRYGWPFPFEQMGHLISSYQNYSSDLNQAYFHHGIDMIAPDGTNVRTPVAGQVVNVEQYSYSELYWEVAILDPEGYVWQYHHIDQPSIPAAIHAAYAAWQADPVNGGFIPANTHIGDIVTWPEFSFGFFFHHIHLNILADDDIYLNPLDFLDDTYVDTQKPVVQKMGLFSGTNSLISGTTLPYGSQYSVYLQARDLFMSQVYYLPPHWITYRINDGETKTVWNFRQLPGGANDQTYVNKFFLPTLTQGNYEQRTFYMDMGFTTDGVNPLPTEPGHYKMDVEVWDYSYNRANWTFRWTITQALADNGCATGQGFIKTYTIEDDSYIQDIDLGVALAHEDRGELRVSVKGPMDSTPTVLIANSSDLNNNYNVLIDDASTLPVNDNGRDDMRPPFFNRSAGPSTDGSLDRYNGMNARGVWEVFVCDNKAGQAGTIWDLDLRILASDNLPPVADAQDLTAAQGQGLPITLTGSDHEGSPLTYHIVQQAQSGSVQGTPPNVIYRPNPGFAGVDSFSFKVNDGELDSAPAFVRVIVLPNLYLPLMLR